MQKIIIIEMPEDLLQPLVGLIDAGLRATGLRSAADAARVADAINGRKEKAAPNSRKGATQEKRSDSTSRAAVNPNGSRSPSQH